MCCGTRAATLRRLAKRSGEMKIGTGRCLWSACREFRTTIERIEEFARFCARQICVDSLQRCRPQKGAATTTKPKKTVKDGEVSSSFRTRILAAVTIAQTPARRRRYREGLPNASARWC